MRWLSACTRSKAARYQVPSRSLARARVVVASITESGVRSSWEASAVNSICRWRKRSIGAATRRPMLSEPENTTASRIGPTIASAEINVDRAWLTASMEMPTTTWSWPITAPARRREVPPKETVSGSCSDQ